MKIAPGSGPPAYGVPNERIVLVGVETGLRRWGEDETRGTEPPMIPAVLEGRHEPVADNYPHLPHTISMQCLRLPTRLQSATESITPLFPALTISTAVTPLFPLLAKQKYETPLFSALTTFPDIIHPLPPEQPLTSLPTLHLVNHLFSALTTKHPITILFSLLTKPKNETHFFHTLTSWHTSPSPSKPRLSVPLILLCGVLLRTGPRYEPLNQPRRRSSSTPQARSTPDPAEKYRPASAHPGQAPPESQPEPRPRQRPPPSGSASTCLTAAPPPALPGAGTPGVARSSAGSGPESPQSGTRKPHGCGSGSAAAAGSGQTAPQTLRPASRSSNIPSLSHHIRLDRYVQQEIYLSRHI